MVRLCVGSDPALASGVRRALHDELTRLGAEAEAVDDLVLVASELLTNSMTHTQRLDDVVIEWFVSGTEATVRVTDVGSLTGTSPVLQSAAPDAAHGRGLAIVDALSDRWGIESGPDSVTVWAVRSI